MTALWPHQAAEVAQHATVPKKLLAWSPRLGKTLAAIESMKAAGYRGKGLVICPLVVAPQWVEQLALAGLPVLRGYAMSTRELAAALEANPLSVIVLNYDKAAYRSPEERRLRKTGLVLRTILKWAPPAVIVDESHYIKDPGTGRAKAVHKLTAAARWVRLLTGTPTPNHYGDLWSQAHCVAPDLWGTWPQFRQTYLITDAIYPSRVIAHINVPELQAKLLRCAGFVRREDVFGPDSWQEVVRTIDLPPAARKQYEHLAKEWILDAEFEPGAAEVRADHVLKRLVRLQQFCAGYLPDELGVLHDVHSAKLDAVDADLSEIVAADEKAVIFHRFRWEGERYEKLAREHTKTVYRISGDTPTAARAAFVRAFAAAPHEAIAIVQTRSGGIGISFAEATHALFVSQSFSFSDEEQARDRIYKRGASRCVTFYQMRETVDEYVADAIRTKTSIHESVRRADRETLAFGRIRRQRRGAA